MSGVNPLLSEFVRTGSEGAFQDLVSAYVNLVYSAAIRSVKGDTQLAQDIVQHVFIDLARVAVTLSPNIQLGGWLYRHTCFLARNAMRGERRRKARERKAIELQRLEDYTEENLQQLTAILDEVINELGAEDRTAILMRFFEQLEFRSIGIATGRSEDAARMRVTRALEKLGALLRRRGFILSTTGLAYVMGAKVLRAAPVALADTATRAGLSAAFKGVSYFSLLKETCLTRLNVGLAGAAARVVLATLLLFGGRPRVINEETTRPQVQVAKENVEAAIAPAAAEVAVVEAETPQEPPKPTARRSVPDVPVRKVSDIRVGNSSPDQSEHKVVPASTRSASPSMVIPVVVTSEKYPSKVTARDSLAEKITNQLLISSRSRKPSNGSGSSNGLAQTVAPTKSVTAVPGRSNPGVAQVNNNIQRQWVSGKLVALPIRVLDRNVSVTGLPPNQRIGTWTPTSRIVGRGIGGSPR